MELPRLRGSTPFFLTLCKVCPVFSIPRVTLVAPWSAMESSRESSPGATAAPRRTGPACTPGSATSWTGFRRPWPRTTEAPAPSLCRPYANKVTLIQPPVCVPAPVCWLWETSLTPGVRRGPGPYRGAERPLTTCAP